MRSIYNSIRKSRGRFKDMTGMQFHAWTVVQHEPDHRRRDGAKCRPGMWKVRCRCGKESVVQGAGLRNGTTKSCGCLNLSTAALVASNKKRTKENHHAWNGGRWPTGKGYIGICASFVRELYPNAVIHGASTEHVAAMSHSLNRALHPNETVHHKNGDRTDNRIENLELRVGNHGPGSSVGEMVEWAADILGRYAPERLR